MRASKLNHKIACNTLNACLQRVQEIKKKGIFISNKWSWNCKTFSNLFIDPPSIFWEPVFDTLLLYEYRDLFIDMAVRNNCSELAMANRHQERWNFASEKSSFTAFDWTNDVSSLVKIYRSAAFWLINLKENLTVAFSARKQSNKWYKKFHFNILLVCLFFVSIIYSYLYTLIFTLI